jgi:hypothetical protein
MVIDSSLCTYKLGTYRDIADIFLAVVTSATEVGNTRPSSSSAPESVAKIHEVSFYCLTSSIWDDLASAVDALPSPDAVDFIVRGVDPSNNNAYQYNHQSPAGAQAQVFEHPCIPLTKILSSGSFYYALEPHWDLSTRLGARLSAGTDASVGGKKDLAAFDERFVWNEYIVRSLLDFRERLDVHEREDLDRCQFIVCFYLTLFSNYTDNYIDPCHTRLRWSVDNGFGRPAYRWLTDHRDALAHLPSGLETRRNTVQHARS